MNSEFRVIINKMSGNLDLEFTNYRGEKLSSFSFNFKQAPATSFDSRLKVFFFGKLFNIKEFLGLNFESENFENKIIELYKKGIECLNKLNGQFIIIIIDLQNNQVLFVRDQIGIKSLYYQDSKDYLFCASNLKILLSHHKVSKEFSVEYALNSYIEPRYFNYQTFYKSIYIVPAGSIFSYHFYSKEIKLKKFYELEKEKSYLTIPDKDISYYINEFRQLVINSIKIRIPQENKYFILLSGGLDSSIIAKVASETNPPISLSMVNLLTLLTGDSQNAFHINKSIEGKLIYFIHSYSSTKTSFNDWKKLLYLSEWPNINFRTLFRYYFNQFISHEYKSDKYIFTGLGCDQFFGGTSVTSLIDNKFRPEDIHWETYYSRLKKLNYSYFEEDNIYKLSEYFYFLKEPYICSNSLCKNISPWLYKLSADTFLFMISDVQPEEKISNFFNNFSVFPYIDHRLISFISKIPINYYKDLLWSKNIVREAFKFEMSDTIRDNIKTGFFAKTKADKWFFNLVTDSKGRLNEELESIFTQSNIFDLNNIQRSLNIARLKDNYSCMTKLLPIINCLLLDEALRKESDIEINDEDASFIPKKIEISDWNIESYLLHKALNIVEPVSNNDINCKSKLAFSKNISLLKDESNENYYVSRNNQLIYEIDSNNIKWINFLKLIDGEKTLEEILHETSSSLSEIEEFLQISLNEEIICNT